MPELPVVLIDGDCAFCRRTAAAVERAVARGVRDPLVRAYQDEDPERYGVSRERAARELLWIEPDGQVCGGPDAFGRWLAWHSGPLRPLGLLQCWPGIRTLSWVCYRWIAEHRGWFSRAGSLLRPTEQ